MHIWFRAIYTFGPSLFQFQYDMNLRFDSFMCSSKFTTDQKIMCMGKGLNRKRIFSQNSSSSSPSLNSNSITHKLTDLGSA